MRVVVLDLHCGNRPYILHRCRLISGFLRSPEGNHSGANQNPDNGDHDHQLDECESALVAGVTVSSFHRYFLKMLNDALSSQFRKELPAPLIVEVILLHRCRSCHPGKATLAKVFLRLACIDAEFWSALTCQRFD